MSVSLGADLTWLKYHNEIPSPKRKFKFKYKQRPPIRINPLLEKRLIGERGEYMNEKKIPQMWSQIRCVALLVGMNLVWMIPLGMQFYQVYIAGGK